MQSLYSALVSYWTLHEASGTRFDATGNANNLTDNNTVTSGDGLTGTAAHFTQANVEFLEIADNADLSGGDRDFTFAAWVNFDTVPGSNRQVLGKGDGVADQTEYALWLNGATDAMRFSVTHDGMTFASVDNSTFGSLAAGVWYFVLGWHDSVNNQIGVSTNRIQDTAAHSLGVFDGTGGFRIGDGIVFGGSTMDGFIDEVGFWSRILTTQERTWLYNNGLGRTYPFDGRPGPALQSRQRRNRLTGIIN